MPTKNKPEISAITNNNKNINNVNVNLQVEHPNLPLKTKPNWIVKAIVVGLIGLAISLLGYYLQTPSPKSKTGIHIQPGQADIGTKP